MKIVRKSAWNICKFLASSAPLGEVKGVCPERWLIVAGTHHFGRKGVSPSMKVVEPFMKFSHDIVYLLSIQSFEQRCCQPSFE